MQTWDDMAKTQTSAIRTKVGCFREVVLCEENGLRRRNLAFSMSHSVAISTWTKK